MENLTLDELLALPTISASQFDNLKIQTEDRRVWLSRCSVEDGEPYPGKVTIEELIAGRWEIVRTYQAGEG